MNCSPMMVQLSYIHIYGSWTPLAKICIGSLVYFQLFLFYRTINSSLIKSLVKTLSHLYKSRDCLTRVLVTLHQPHMKRTSTSHLTLLLQFLVVLADDSQPLVDQEQQQVRLFRHSQPIPQGFSSFLLSPI